MSQARASLAGLPAELQTSHEWPLVLPPEVAPVCRTSQGELATMRKVLIRSA